MLPISNPLYVRVNAKCDRRISLYGYVRGAPLRNKSRIHLPGCGDFVVNDVTLLPDPCPLSLTGEALACDCTGNYFDDCGFKGNFSTLFRREIEAILPEFELKDIPHNHELYRTYYQLLGPPTGGDVFWGGGYQPKTTQFKSQKGIFIGKRLTVVVNRKDYLCCMETSEVDSRAQLQDRRSPDVHRFMTNLLVYTMKYGGNTDRSEYKR